jgi:hypothetical protein
MSGTCVQPSPIHGQGLFAETRVEPGTVLAKLDGQVVSPAEAPGVVLALEWNALSPERLLVRPIRTSYGFINHSRTPNLRIHDLAVVATSTIAPDSELLLDYLEQPLPADFLAHPSSEYLRR